MKDNKALNQLLKSKEYLIKSCIKRLNIYKDYDDFFQIGMIALYKSTQDYDETLDGNKNFDVYAYYMILNSIRNEIKRVNRYYFNNEQYITTYNGPTYYEFQNDLSNMIDYDAMIKYLSNEERDIIEMRKSGLKNFEIAKILRITSEQLKYKLKIIFKKIRKNL